MKRIKSLGLLLIVTVIGIAVLGCASGPTGADLTPSSTQAVINVTRLSAAQGSLARWNIIIDGVDVGTVSNNSVTRILVDNGQRTIQIRWSNLLSDEITFTAASNEVSFTVETYYRNNFPALRLTQ